MATRRRLVLRKETLRRIVPLSDRQLGAVAGGSRTAADVGGTLPYSYDSQPYSDPYGYGGYRDDYSYDPQRTGG